MDVAEYDAHRHAEPAAGDVPILFYGGIRQERSRRLPSRVDAERWMAEYAADLADPEEREFL